MALTIADVGQYRRDPTPALYCGTVTFDSSYPTNGESLTAANLGLTSIDMLIAEAASGYVFEYDYTNSKLKAYVRGAITENVAGSYTQNAVLAAAALAEVANTTDLSAVTCRIIAVGTR